MSGSLHVEHISAAVVLLTLDRPPANALDADLLVRIDEQLNAVAEDKRIRAVILTGAGKCFCAGADIKDMSSGAEKKEDSFGPFGKMLDTIETLRVPVIAAINGACAGGGLELALACDIRLASRDAFFIAAGVNMGLVAAAVRLPRLIGINASKTMLYSGSRTDAATAQRYGLVGDVVEADALRTAAIRLAERIATRAPLSVEATKRILHNVSAERDRELNAMMGAEVLALSKTDDHKAAVEAFVAGKAPVFTRS